jgi:FKBP-type peptidyl-prolyl cis-trans isomerase SlyD
MSKSVVTFHYTLKDPNGQLLDTSIGGQPISFLEGASQIIDGLEKQLLGLPVGTKRMIQVAAAEAYGERDDSQIQRVPRSAIPVEGELAVGDQFQAGEDQFAPVVTVVGIEADYVLLDANHPLAGVDLTFDVEVVDIRAANDDELAHGHAHGADGAPHN